MQGENLLVRYQQEPPVLRKGDCLSACSQARKEGALVQYSVLISAAACVFLD